MRVEPVAVSDESRQIYESGAIISLAHAAAHDLRSPLNTICNLSQFLEVRYAAALDPRGLDCLHMMQNASARIRQLVDSLVLYTEVCAGKAEPTRFSAGAPLAETMRRLEEEIRTTKATVITYAPLPEVSASPQDLRLIFDQLIGNALVHRGASPPRITIVAEADGSQMRFTVSDNGPGIEAEFHDVVFEPLKRLQSPEVPGSGLGLTIARQLVRRNGGRLWLESELGQGASFFFTLPA